jgi:hypothetical protein
VVGLKAERLEVTHAVRVSGLVLHSALAVKDIRLSSAGEFIDVDLDLISGERAPSGSFEFVVFLKPETRAIRFGQDRVIVWSAKGSP